VPFWDNRYRKLICDTQHKRHSAIMLRLVSNLLYAECHALTDGNHIRNVPFHRPRMGGLLNVFDQAGERSLLFICFVLWFFKPSTTEPHWLPGLFELAKCKKNRDSHWWQRLGDFSEQCCEEKSKDFNAILIWTRSIDFLQFSFLCSISRIF